MERCVTTWLAWFASVVASATGIIGLLGPGSSWADASAREMTSSWGHVSFESLNKTGGIRGGGRYTEVSKATYCHTGQCRSVGGHGFVCTDIGSRLQFIQSGGFIYTSASKVVCGNEWIYPNTNCTGTSANNGACNAGRWTWTDYYDP